jgi:hypothetical protein
LQKRCYYYSSWAIQFRWTWLYPKPEAFGLDLPIGAGWQMVCCQ